MKDQREKSLCYNCDEKCGPNHICAIHKLYLLNADIPSDSVAEEDAVAMDDHDNHHGDTPKISFNSLPRFSSPQTMKCRG